ncbi:MAG: thiamine pyrophosphate-dependent dehydrogenase E1 component subunit alpha [Bacteroidota bacterium]
MEYTKDFLTGLYRMMLRIRLAEESLVDPIKSGAIRCPVHLYSGQEAIATGIGAMLEKKDYIFGNHRSHGHYLAKGGDMGAMIAEIYGMESGCSHGRGGSMHLIDPENGVLGIVPIVAGTISLALGASLASSIRNDQRVTFSFFGDGATGEGVLYESLNFASLKKLPIIFACENNFYSTHLPIREIRVKNSIADVGMPFGVDYYQADGNDVLAVVEVVEKAIANAREGNGPAFIEFFTYRLRGHVGPDDNIQGSHTDIRPKEEVEAWIKKDPIIRFEKHLLQENILTEVEIKTIHASVEEEVRKANEFALASVKPPKEEVCRYVFR